MEFYVNWYEPDYRPRSIPTDIAQDLAILDRDPFDWISGQMARFLLNMQPGVRDRVRHEIRRMNISHPIVGMHVRRTDKIIEASYQPLDEYFDAAELYFSQLDSSSGGRVQRRVLIATDELSVIQEARQRYDHTA